MLLPASDVVREADISSWILVAKVKARGKSRVDFSQTLPPPSTPNKNPGDPYSRSLCCLVTQPSTSAQDARTTCGGVLFTLDSHSGTRAFALLAQRQHPKRYLAISVLNGPTPYSLRCYVNLKLITRTFEVALTVLTAELSALTASGGQLTQARDGVTADGI